MKISFEIPRPVLVVTAIIILGILMSGSWTDVLTYLRKEKTLISIHGSLIAGSFALLAGYLALYGSKCQIADQKLHRLHEQICVARAYISACYSQIGAWELYYKRIDQLDINKKSKYSIFMPKENLKIISNDSFFSLLNDWNFYSKLPSDVHFEFLELRTLMADAVITFSSLESMSEQPKGKVIRLEDGSLVFDIHHWEKLSKILDRVLNDCEVKLENMCKKHKFLRP